MLVQFAAPLLEAAGDDPERQQRAFTLATAFWNLALLEPEQQDDVLADLLKVVARDEDDVSAFRGLAANMVARHRDLFPELEPSALVRAASSREHVGRAVESEPGPARGGDDAVTATDGP